MILLTVVQDPTFVRFSHRLRQYPKRYKQVYENITFLLSILILSSFSDNDKEYEQLKKYESLALKKKVLGRIMFMI